MKFCYLDESGTGNEPFAIMTGIIVDAKRMHVTKSNWSDLLNILEDILNREISEFHTRDFYKGNSPWRSLDGNQRSAIISAILNWLSNRRHKISFVGIDKEVYRSFLQSDPKLRDLLSLWCTLGVHQVLCLQKYFQSEQRNKGNTVFIFDNEEREKTKFLSLLTSLPDWTDTYYSRKITNSKINQMIDVPYFGDSKQVNLIQVADLISYLLRRYTEIKENRVQPSYVDEEEKLSTWVAQIVDISLPASTRYPLSGRCDCSNLLFDLAPQTIKELGR